MKWEWKAPWMLALLTLQNVPALQLLHCRPLAQSPAEKHQNYVLDHVFLPQHPSIVFSVLSLLLALGALVPVRIQNAFHLESDALLVLVFEVLQLHIGNSKSGPAFRSSVERK